MGAAGRSIERLLMLRQVNLYAHNQEEELTLLTYGTDRNATTPAQ